ncbi:amidophosphoribosyltransferase [Photobacterium swingsii]|uniref:Amidophosphoribosyltransferase n=1 Tax=Photobacterium swingsii TaxID=680026 RepID=A0A0J8VD80_9GAMM|nr:amidophosphoribosyltransferase [Photobacterium swingsii]KMV30485.1 amidophosphoribosyltransferase [Photobacterium swingsii]PSW23741.1 amidophosphoribosyltransferase [Photobacterium swingsii]
MLSPSRLRSILDWTNQRCQLCHLPLTNNERVWCHHCISHFPQPPYCRRCGATTLTYVDRCGYCLSSPPPWQRLFRLGEYRPPLRQCVQRYKFNGKFWLAHPLGQHLAAHIENPAPLLLPVPLHPRRRWLRGFNQSTALAWSIAAITGSQVAPHGFHRIRHTPVQKQLSRHQRQQNLRGAFELTLKNLPHHVAIVDDVVTTGSTASALTNLLKRSGVQTIDIYCICYTPMPK